MSRDRRRAISTPGEQADPARRGPASVLVSVAIHLVAIAILVRVAIVPFQWFGIDSNAAKPEAVHVNYVRVPADTGSRRPAKAGGDNRPVTKVPPAAPIVAPSEVPSALPPEPPKAAAPPAPAAGGTGMVIGGGGPTRGVMPSFTDPRLWAPSAPAPVAPKTSTEKLDSLIASRVHHLEDSLRAISPERAAGDWSWNGKDGKKYGVDQKYIHLGNFSIPTALLALLPLNVQGNPSAYENAKRIGNMRAEILEQEARAARDADFNLAVKQLRERAQKQRAEKAKEDQAVPEAPPPKKIIP